MVKPQWGQNFACSATSAPQFGQLFAKTNLLVLDKYKAQEDGRANYVDLPAITALKFTHEEANHENVASVSPFVGYCPCRKAL